MHVEWYGQSAFALRANATTVFIDPFGDVSALAARGLQFAYPLIEGVQADLLLVTHEHLDQPRGRAVAAGTRAAQAQSTGA